MNEFLTLLKPILEMGVNVDKWQRDNIYYRLSNNKNKGPLQRNFAERIVGIQFTEKALIYMSDSNDPSPKKEVSSYPGLLKQSDFWTEGNFEFKMDVFISNKNGFGNVITKIFSAKPTELFNIEYTEIPILDSYSLYKQKKITCEWYDPNITLITWDLENNAFSWKFTLHEIDDQETYVTEQSKTGQYATNFGFDSTIGDKVKIGLKFGVSETTTNTTKFSVTTYKNSDDMGSLEANFSDPIILERLYVNSHIEVSNYYSISNPFVSIIMMPEKLY